MISAWILYSLLLGVILALGALLADKAAAAAQLPRRFVWMGALFLLIALTAVAPWREGERASASTIALPTPTLVTGTAMMAPPLSVRERVVRVLTYPTHHAIGAVSARIPQALDRAVGILWLMGSAVSLLTLWVVLRRLDRQRRAWPLATMHGQRVRVAAQHGPAVYGVLNPDIVLPSALLARPSHEQQLVLSHEAEHRRARDPFVLSAAALAAALVPWHPVAWWMASRLRLAVELDCDARVLRHGASPRQYGELLLALSHSLPTRRNSLHALALLDSPRHLERRLIAMTSRTSRRAPLTIAGFLLAGAAVIVTACSTDVPTAAQIRDADVNAMTQTLRMPSGPGVRYVVDGTPVAEAEAKALKAEQIASISVTGDVVGMRAQKVSASGSAEVRIVTHGYAVDADTLPRRQRVAWSGDTAARADSIKLYVNDDTLVFRGDSIPRVNRDTLVLRGDSISFVLRDSVTVFSQTAVGNARDSAPRVLLRGGARPTGGEPLLVIDGVIVADGMGKLQSINPNDIETIEVVKGNAAAAKYGSRASNGVISITMKRIRQRM